MFFRTFAGSILVAVVGLVAGFVYGGGTGLTLTAILAVLEVSLSFDNAVVNATVLVRMSPFWQRIFLTVGVSSVSGGAYDATTHTVTANSGATSIVVTLAS